jgi:tetratricopeptide (TPR) repeat protein
MTIRIIFFVILIAMPFSNLALAQEVDPFYLNLVEKGEQAFLDGNYEDAVKQLRIAYFGIRTNDEIKARVCVYLGLSYYYLKNTAEGQKYLNEAQEFLGDSGIEALNIDEQAKFDFNRLTKASESGKTIRVEGLLALPQIPAERVPQGELSSRQELERGIEDNPKNISQYYELYSVYRLSNSFKEAKKTIEKLLDNNSEEPFAYYMLGLVLYQERNFKDAASQLNLFFQQSASLQVEPETLAEARAHQILSLYYNGNRKDASSLIAVSQEILPLSSILSRHLNNRDRIVLRGLLEEAYK